MPLQFSLRVQSGFRVLLALGLLALGGLGQGAEPAADPPFPRGTAPELLQELKTYPYKLLYESRRTNNFEIYLANADGSHPVNLTHTPEIDELYPKASPDGTMICFVADQGKGKARIRNLYLMNLDGSGRKKIADNAREPCWSADGKSIAFLKGEFNRFELMDFVTRGIFIYDLASGQTRQHPNTRIEHLFCLNWTPDGKWFIATIHGGMGFSHSIVALAAGGDAVFDLNLHGCRPDVSADGKHVAWANGDHAIGVADLDLSGPNPKAVQTHDAIQDDLLKPQHADWSPDGRYLVFSFGTIPKDMPHGGLGEDYAPTLTGMAAPGRNLCVADPKQKNRWVAITLDGASYKEPDWVKVE